MISTTERLHSSVLEEAGLTSFILNMMKSNIEIKGSYESMCSVVNVTYLEIY